jgi:hypothetical protein
MKWQAAQLAASQEGLSSISERVSYGLLHFLASVHIVKVKVKRSECWTIMSTLYNSHSKMPVKEEIYQKIHTDSHFSEFYHQ